jgi:DNA repair photolyase
MNITSGTKEWANKNINWCKGCIHACRYCYAMKNALRFGRITDIEKWKDFELNLKLIKKRFLKTDKIYMMPSSHDIFPEILDESIQILKNVLEPGNKVLLVTKGNPNCIEEICNKLSSYRNLMEIRITITHNLDEYLKFWEPGAPNFYDRLLSLRIAKETGFKTSVSIEPLLTKQPEKIIEQINNFADSIWIGKLNHFNLGNSKDILEQHFFHDVRLIEKNLGKIIINVKRNCDFKGIYNNKIHWKDSMKPYLESIKNELNTKFCNSIFLSTIYEN